ncbi:arsenate reductase/protein-tyrosine-phosphatase family protein [Agromyces atrinae]|uniref:Low molecular weight phosphatase family protein n=1 Tax=Agromyces atrinae TaxID=592376 RepID=A0A4Q2M3U9_9MICO|nr:low molecular weight phosphatase family protein [Agromyces atrinae]NYD68501.1 protein-tyrosine phosphatase [Agromyces atrinae]RXZ85887.1 low molecular weight phosphatase family protein [Agromyces atrinae]
MNILVVCTGNICRSPLAEQVLRERLAEAGVTATVESAGTRAMDGHEMTPQSADLARALGVSDTTHTARQITPALIEAADLVLVASRSHRREVVEEVPRAGRYTFTLRELARLIEAASADGTLDQAPLRASIDLVSEIAALRGAFPPPADPADDDIVDPYRREQSVYDEAGRLIDDSTRVIAAALAAAAPVAANRSDGV